MSKYIQSFYNYPVIFSSIGKGVPARDADGPMRNVVEITDAEYSVLERREPIFRAMVRDRKYRVLDYMPDSAKPDAERINEAKQEAKAAKEVKAELAKENEALKAQIEELKKLVVEAHKPSQADVDAAVEMEIACEKAAEKKAPAKKKTTSKKKIKGEWHDKGRIQIC